MSRVLWGALAIGCIGYAVAAAALAPKTRLSNVEGQALERAARHRERGDVDLAIAELESARKVGAEGDILLASLGVAYLKTGDHETATPLLAEGLKGLYQRKRPVGIAAALIREASHGLFSCYLRQGSPEAAWRVAHDDSGPMHPYATRALAWGYPDLADRLIGWRLSREALNVPGSERHALGTAAVAAAVERDDLGEALVRGRALSASLVQQPPTSQEGMIEQIRRLSEAVAGIDGAPAAREQARLARADQYFRLGLRMKGLREITGGNEPRDRANLVSALRLQASAYGELGLVIEAIEARQRLVELVGSDIDSRWDLAQRLRDLGRFGAAEHEVRFVLDREPHRGRAWLLMGDVRRRLGDLDEACDAYVRGILLIAEGSAPVSAEGIDTTASPLAKALVAACENLASVAAQAGRPQDELQAWATILDLAYVQGKLPTDPPADWLAERGRYRVYTLTGVAPPPLPHTEGAFGGTLLGGR